MCIKTCFSGIHGYTCSCLMASAFDLSEWPQSIDSVCLTANDH